MPASVLLRPTISGMFCARIAFQVMNQEPRAFTARFCLAWQAPTMVVAPMSYHKESENALDIIWEGKTLLH